jgi:hypothetical protein
MFACTGKVVPMTGTSFSVSSLSNLVGTKANIITTAATNSTQNANTILINSSNNNNTGNSVVSNNTIILPAGQGIPSASELSNFINTIKPPAIPGVATATGVQQQQKPQQIILQKGTTLTPVVANAAGVKKQIIPAAGSSGGIQILNASTLSGLANAAGNASGGPYKIIMTSGGQQILLNASDLCNLTAAVNKSNTTTTIKSEPQPVTVVSAGTSGTTTAAAVNNSQPQKAILSTGPGGQQQIVFLSSSPLKPGSAGQVVKLANVSGSGTIQQIQSGMNQFYFQLSKLTCYFVTQPHRKI